MGPVICMITSGACDSRGAGEELLVARIAAAARAGVHLVQVRERALDGGSLLRLVRRCVDAVRATHTRIIVNDRADVALAGGAHGVHLRGDSVPATAVRGIAPSGFLVGRSVHSEHEAASAWTAGGLDYLLFGTVFATASKPGVPPAGVDALARVTRSVPVPVLAVGGVTVSTAADVARAGAAGFAAIGLFDAAPDDIAASVAAATQLFATPKPVA